MDSDERVVVFLRAHNDTDQIVPVLYKLLETETATVDVVFIGSNPLPLSDYRLSFLDEYDGFTYQTLADLQKSETDDAQSLPSRVTSTAINRLKELGRRAPTRLPEQVWTHLRGTQSNEPDPAIGELIFDAVLGDDPNAVAIFDWPPDSSKYMYKLIETIVDTAAQRNIDAISLPHGDSPHYNALAVEGLIEELIENGEFATTTLDLFERTWEVHTNLQIFDAVVVPNEITARREHEHIEADKLHVLGSARYNDEWLGILDEIAPAIPLDSKGKTNIVFFLREQYYLISQSQLRLAVQLLAQLPDTEVIVAEHPRGIPVFDDPAEAVEASQHFQIVSGTYESASLLQWGDIFLDIGTSIAFEAVMREKPLLDMSFLTGNENTTGHYLETASMESFDEFYNTLSALLDGEIEVTYTDAERQQFVNGVIYGDGNTNVLQSYVDLVRSHL